MTRRRSEPTLDGLTVSAVRAVAGRNAAPPDEEFGNFATRPDFPDLVADHDVWAAGRPVGSVALYFPVTTAEYYEHVLTHSVR